MRIVSFYTDKYQSHVKGLISSLQRFDLRYDIEHLADLGNWRANCKHKADYILEKLEVHNEPVVWIDADARVKQYPELLVDLDCDMAARFKESGRLMSGTLLFNPTDKAKDLLHRWMWINADRDAWDQKNLQYVLDDEDIYHLPQSYCQKFDEPEPNTVIKHYMASRQLGHG